MMTTIIFSAAAILLYLLAAGCQLARLFNPGLNLNTVKTQLIAFGGLALLAHALVLWQTIIIPDAFNLGFYNALSLMSWVVSFLVVAVAFFKPVENLAIVFLPVTALTMVLPLILTSDHILSESSSIGLRMHILFSVAAYSLLAIAALQAIVLAIQDHQLRGKHPARMMRVLPPMQTMEELLIQLLAIGFFLLSLSLATGLMFVHNIFAQHLVHKTVLSIVAWSIFGVILWGRWSLGWRGKKLIRWTLGGFVSLMLAYFGSKLVLEVILHRV